MKIAIIGSGISGLSAAYALKNQANITLYEKRARLGGHSHTINIDYDGTPLNVDAGFIVYNAHNYPNLIELFKNLDVETSPSDMSFAVSNPDGFEWSSNPKGLFAWKRNLFNPRFHKFWRDILKFNDIARKELSENRLTDRTLGDWLDRHGFNTAFRDNYILPMGGAIWSMPEADILSYPALSFFKFFENHRLMNRERPAWRTVTGGSQTYVKRLEALLEADTVKDRAVTKVSRAPSTQSGNLSDNPSGGRLCVELETGERDYFDHVIMAAHSDQSQAMLSAEDFTSAHTCLGGMRYAPNRIYLHRDEAFMPARRRAWAAWNVLRQNPDHMCVTYWMNILQGLPRDKPVFVTLNPAEPPDPAQTFVSYEFDHPQFDAPAADSVARLKAMNGQDGLWFAGAWMGSGFHEDGLKSGLEVALALGGKVPWEPQNLHSYAKTEKVPRRRYEVTA